MSILLRCGGLSCLLANPKERFRQEEAGWRQNGCQVLGSIHTWLNRNGPTGAISKLWGWQARTTKLGRANLAEQKQSYRSYL